MRIIQIYSHTHTSSRVCLCGMFLTKEDRTQTGFPSIYSRRRKIRSERRCRRPARQATSTATSIPLRSSVWPFPHHGAVSSSLQLFAHRSHRQEDHTLEGWARNKPEPANGPVGQAVRLKGADPPRVLARRYGQRWCADERTCTGRAERPMVPSR